MDRVHRPARLQRRSSPAEEAALRAHLDACPACRAAQAETVALGGPLRAAAPAMRSPRLRPETGSPLRRLGWLAAAAAAHAGRSPPRPRARA
ncbi:MAG: zf-HC2 domain-containing protein [Kiritimatiellia bacterium]